MKTLAELNANPTISDRGEFTTQSGYAVGGMGRSFSATHSGAKFHLIRTETVIARDEAAIAAKRERFPAYRAPALGAVVYSAASCNGNGSHTGIIARGYDTDRVNCKNCGG